MTSGTLSLADGEIFAATLTRLHQDTGDVSFYRASLVNLGAGGTPVSGFFVNGQFSVNEEVLRNSETPKSPSSATPSAVISSSSPQNKHRRTAIMMPKR